MIIGNFTYDRNADTYRGDIETLTFRRAGVVLQPLKKANDREPDYRVTAATDSGSVELGAAWARRSDRGNNYLSMLLDDPAFGQPLNVALFPRDDGKPAALIWTRSTRQAAAPEARPARSSGRKAAPRNAAPV